ncbi:outer membrane lipoprotein carrier protein LolA [Schlegelella sp. S2-27]|uniref:Outer membrane lipoprotein carrier protein LolA n=1 Tax=Caldimonas mangrovi TaxID=2944811 RepID=A0ABT0YVB4_9BURK|nr:outer membrane lipoprotein carrier protein LolA [Caldimonas mangrovi]MCM5682690.1 outer membrane lipoprotein carrier protein LolA [Caldimonas mangrovi]
MLNRRRALQLLGGLAVLGAAPVAAARDVITEVQARLVETVVLRGQFEQTRTLKGFRRPLVSRGEFLVAKGRGVVWQTRQPFESTLVLTRERLVVREADGSSATRLDARTEPAVRTMNEVMFALMAGDLPVLTRRFRAEGELLGKEGWRLVLTPVEPGLAAQFSRLGLDGDRHVRTVRIEEASGDVSVIRLSDLQPAAVLTRDEEDRFESAPRP